MNDQQTHLHKLLADKEMNLNLIEVRIAAYVRTVDVPLDLVREKKELEQEIVSLKQRIDGTSEPTTYIVDEWHRGHFVTISEAIEQAAPGSRILVRPGVYEESLVLDKPLEIIGEGDWGDVVVETKEKNTLLFKTRVGRVENLTLRQAGGKDVCCVDIASGRLTVEKCDITSNSGNCVVIRDGANPILRRNRIHDGALYGVYVHRNGQGTLEENEIFAHTRSGVVIENGGKPTLRRNNIYNGKSVGIRFAKNGQGRVEDNHIYANAKTGVQIGESSTPTLRCNRIHKNSFYAVSIVSNGGGTFEENDLRGNTKGSWRIAADCEANVQRTNNLEDQGEPVED